MHPDVYQATSQDDLKKMYRALVKTLDWIADPANDQEFFTLVKAMFAKNPDYPSIESLEAFRKIRASTVFIEPQDLYGYNTTILTDTYDTMKTVLSEIDMPYDFAYNEVVDTSVLLEVLEEMGLTDKPAATE